MKKVIIAIILFLLITIISLGIYVFVAQREVTNKNTSRVTETPGTTAQPYPDDEKMTIKTDNGDILVNNLYKNPVAMLYHNGVMFLQTADYDMSFYPDDQGFITTLLNPDLQKSRDEAEKAFLETLDITKEQACFLKVNLGTTSDISQKAAGQNFGLSFCPNGKPLPDN